MADKAVGKVAHYYDKICVAVVDVTGQLKVGDTIKIAGKAEGDELVQTVESMEIDHEKVKEAKKGQSVGLKVDKKVYQGTPVYKVNE